MLEIDRGIVILNIEGAGVVWIDIGPGKSVEIGDLLLPVESHEARVDESGIPYDLHGSCKPSVFTLEAW